MEYKEKSIQLLIDNKFSKISDLKKERKKILENKEYSKNEILEKL